MMLLQFQCVVPHDVCHLPEVAEHADILGVPGGTMLIYWGYLGVLADVLGVPEGYTGGT